MKRLFAILIAAGVCIIVVSLVVSHRRDAQRAARRAAWEKMKTERVAEWERASKPAPPPQTTAVAPMLSERPSSSPVENAGSAASELVKTAPPLIANAPSSTRTVVPPFQPRPGKKEWQDPLAREALSFVGADPEAEEVWADAINNPDLPPNERKDLIEDLNEDGFPDPKNVTEEDLPLILSRLRLIEAHGPYALDDVNAAAFREAYKDLVQMYLRLVGQ